MEESSYKRNIENYEKLIAYAKNVLKDCGYDEDSHQTYNKRMPTDEEFSVFTHQAKLIVKESLGDDSPYLRYIKNNIATSKGSSLFGHIFKKNILSAYNIYKKMSVFEGSVKKEKQGLSNEDVIYELAYDDFSRQILIIDKKNNKTFLLKTPHYDSENKVIFEYLFKHAQEIVKLKALEDEVKKELNSNLVVSLHRVAHELGFKGPLKKLFLNTTKETAMLRKNVTAEQLKKSNINLGEILKRLSLLK